MITKEAVFKIGQRVMLWKRSWEGCHKKTTNEFPEGTFLKTECVIDWIGAEEKIAIVRSSKWADLPNNLIGNTRLVRFSELHETT